MWMKDFWYMKVVSWYQNYIRKVNRYDTLRYLAINELSLVRRQVIFSRRCNALKSNSKHASIGREVSQIACILVGTPVNIRGIDVRSQQVQLFSVDDVVEEDRRQATAAHCARPDESNAPISADTWIVLGNWNGEARRLVVARFVAESSVAETSIADCRRYKVEIMI